MIVFNFLFFAEGRDLCLCRYAPVGFDRIRACRDLFELPQETL